MHHKMNPGQSFDYWVNKNFNMANKIDVIYYIYNKIHNKTVYEPHGGALI